MKLSLNQSLKNLLTLAAAFTRQVSISVFILYVRKQL